MKAKLLPNYKLRLIEGTGAKGPYAFVASAVGIEDPKTGAKEVHDIKFDCEVWDSIALAGCALSTIWFEGELLRYDDPSKRYIVNENDPKNRYERMLFRGELADIEDSRGSALAFQRGARLPSVAKLRARNLAAAGIAVAPSEAPAEEAAK